MTTALLCVAAYLAVGVIVSASLIRLNPCGIRGSNRIYKSAVLIWPVHAIVFLILFCIVLAEVLGEGKRK